MSTAAVHKEEDHGHHHEETFVTKYIFSQDHKMISKQYLITGLFEPKKVGIAGVIVLFFRVLGGIGYLYGKRMFGAPFHFGELYLLYLTLIVSYNLIFKKLFNESKMTGGGLEDLN